MKFEITKEWLLNGEDLDEPELDFSAGDPSSVASWLWSKEERERNALEQARLVEEYKEQLDLLDDYNNGL